MLSVNDIYELLTQKAPLETKQDFDNVGLLAGFRTWPVTRVLLALDITGDVIAQARHMGAELIVSHHPLFFDLKTVTDETPEGERTLQLLESRIAAICMHTNLDAAAGGVNDALAAKLAVREPKPFEPMHIGRIGSLDAPAPLMDFLKTVKTQLKANGLRYCASGSPVQRVAVGGGSCGHMLEEAFRTGCDTFVTADVKYDVFLRARELHVNLIDAGHFPTENVVIPVLRDWLCGAFMGLEVRMADQTQPELYYM